MTPSLAAIIQNHIAYDKWATDRLLDAVEQLTPEQRTHDFGTADKSVQGTLVHLFRSGRLWLDRLRYGTPSVHWGVPEDENWPDLRPKWIVLQHQWETWGSGLTDEDAAKIVEYNDLKNRKWAQPLWHIMLHVINHGTHHRGQVSGFVRASGVVPPPLDFIAFMRQGIQPK